MAQQKFEVSTLPPNNSLVGCCKDARGSCVRQTTVLGLDMFEVIM